ncbi:MAG: CDP-diacylglycerol--glycerol-3-phosphate 3-phosphatidyltransferase [bacterium]
MSVPNALTALRILLVPAFVLAFLYRLDGLALGSFLLAGFTDALDGWLARLRKESSALGAILDPIADKLLMVSAFALLGTSGTVAPWMLVTVLTREVVVVGGWIVRHLLTRSSTVRPSRLGKAAMLAQAVAIAALLLSRQGGMAPSFAGALLTVAVGITAWSGLDYLYRGLRELGPG